MYDKIHWGDMVIVDEDAEERLEFGFDLFDDLNFGEGLQIHFLNTRDTKDAEYESISFHFLLSFIRKSCHFLLA